MRQHPLMLEDRGDALLRDPWRQGWPFRQARRRDQGFGGYAGRVEAFPSHLALLDEHGPHAEGGGGSGDRKPRGARPDDA